MTRSKTISLIFALILSPGMIYLLKAGWKLTEFFHKELLHSHLMALGDAREPTVVERLNIGLIWLPWAGGAFSILLIYYLLLRAVVKNHKLQP